MDRELICTWLHLPPGNWPPDYYALLGLKPGECDFALIEKMVHERMDKVRRYQLTHPELATEAMNRLAQALVCLTDPEAKQVYDAALLPGKPIPFSQPPPVRLTASRAGEWPGLRVDDLSNREPVAATLPPGQTLVDWESSPPPLRRPAEKTETHEHSATLTEDNQWRPLAEELELGSLRPRDFVAKTQYGQAVSFTSGRELGAHTRRGLYYRVALVRQLLWAWEQVGGFLNEPGRSIQRPSEAAQLIHHMALVRELLSTTPPSLGQAGEPGYLVLALARQPLVVPMLTTLLPSQREALARDWRAGHALLRAERQHLLHALRSLRARSRWLTFLRTVAAASLSSPSLLLLFLAIFTVDVIFPELRDMWLSQTAALAALLGLKFLGWWLALRPIRPRWIPPLVAVRRPSSTGLSFRHQAGSSSN